MGVAIYFRLGTIVLSSNNLKDSPKTHPGLTKVVYMFLASESHDLSQDERKIIVF